jgi:hypothetical protein
MEMTSLDLAQVLKEEVQRLNEQISALTRRRNVLAHYSTRLRLGVKPEVVRAEIAAAGEAMPDDQDSSSSSRPHS